MQQKKKKEQEGQGRKIKNAKGREIASNFRQNVRAGFIEMVRSVIKVRELSHRYQPVQRKKKCLAHLRNTKDSRARAE